MMKLLTSVSIEPTNDCNMDCPYCWRKDRPIGYMDMDLYKKIVDQLPFYLRVCLSFGGESGLHPQLDQMIQYARGRFRQLQLYTNGTIEYHNIHTVLGAKPPGYIITRDFKVVGSPPEAKYDKCRSLYRSMGVLWDGRVVPCCADIAGIHVMGDAKNSPLKDIWNSQTYQALRRIGHCANCEAYRYFGGDGI